MSRLADFHDKYTNEIEMVSLKNDGTVEIQFKDGVSQSARDTILADKSSFDFGSKSESAKRKEALDRLIQAEVVKGERK